MSSLEAFGQRIRALRTEKNLSQQQLAELIYVSRKTVGNWESGNRLPDITMVSRLARSLDVEICDLLEELSGGDTTIHVIAVSENPAFLRETVSLLGETLPRARVHSFSSGESALRFCGEHSVSVAFLDVDTASVRAIASKLKEKSARTNLIFLSGDEGLAPDALRVRASGYVCKPLSREKILEEAANLRFPVRRLV